MHRRTDAVTKQVPLSGSYSGCFPLRKMVNKDMNGFPVKKCSAFQFFKKRVRRWIKKPSSSKDKHQNKHLKYTPGSTVMHITPTPEDSEFSPCQSYLDDHLFDNYTTSQESQMHYWESQRSCSTVMKPCKKDAVSPVDQKTFWSSNDSGSKLRIRRTDRSNKSTAELTHYGLENQHDALNYGILFQLHVDEAFKTPSICIVL